MIKHASFVISYKNMTDNNNNNNNNNRYIMILFTTRYDQACKVCNLIQESD